MCYKGLPLAPLRNYNALAVGFNFETGDFCESAVCYNIPDGMVPPDMMSFRLCMKKYAESRGVEMSGGDLVVTKWVELLESEA